MPDNRIALAEDETAVAVGAAACIDVWMGGDRSWRTRGVDGPSVEFMAGADWEMAVLLTKAVLSAVIPEGSRIIEAGHLPMPRNADEAKAMWLFGERWMRDNAPDALRADNDAGGAVAEIKAELPESLRDVQVRHGVRMLRMGHDAQREKEARWFRAICLLLPLVDRAAGEGLEWSEDGDSPRMDAADICVSVAEALGCELGDPAMMALLEKGQAEIRTLASQEGSRC